MSEIQQTKKNDNENYDDKKLKRKPASSRVMREAGSSNEH